MKYPYDDDCWLPPQAEGPTHLSKSLMDAIKHGDVIRNGDTLSVSIKLPYHRGHLPNILGEE